MSIETQHNDDESAFLHLLEECTLATNQLSLLQNLVIDLGKNVEISKEKVNDYSNLKEDLELKDEENNKLKQEIVKLKEKEAKFSNGETLHLLKRQRSISMKQCQDLKAELNKIKNEYKILEYKFEQHQQMSRRSQSTMERGDVKLKYKYIEEKLKREQEENFHLLNQIQKMKNEKSKLEEELNLIKDRRRAKILKLKEEIRKLKEKIEQVEEEKRLEIEKTEQRYEERLNKLREENEKVLEKYKNFKEMIKMKYINDIKIIEELKAELIKQRKQNLELKRENRKLKRLVNTK